ncbi:MAG TPA: hypothetical protein VHK91_04525, partial [Flavisolibacter sp.]|nr:hypothetical protein [Flavisolibacter sp.]
MNKPQWITLGIAVFLVCGIYAATQNKVFGEKKRSAISAGEAHSHSDAVTVDSILFHAKEGLTKEQVARLSELENSISRGDVANQKIHLYHQLARFWGDTARLFAPYAWYTAEAARLENSEKSLTFAARLFLEGLKHEETAPIKQWEALQAKDLFERSLKMNPNNDSSKVSLGAVYLYGGLSSPMEGIGMIREVVSRDSTNLYAQMTLGEASLTSGQMDKAIERFTTVVRLQPDNLEAIFRIAEIYERQEQKAEAAD